MGRRRSWAEFYQNVHRSRRLLEGNILTHAPFVATIAQFVRPGAEILEIGSGTGVLGAPLVEAGCRVVSLDNDPEVIKMGQDNCQILNACIEFVEGDAFDIPFPEGKFDVAYSGGLLEHFTDGQIGRLVAEHRRVAKVAVIGVSLAGGEHRPLGDERWLTFEEWENLLRPHGLRQGSTYLGESMGTFVLEGKGG